MVTPERQASRPRPRARHRSLVEISGDAELRGRLEEPLRSSLETRRAYYRIHVEHVGRCGEVLVCLNGAKGRLPILFQDQDLEPDHIASTVWHAVERFGF